MAIQTASWIISRLLIQKQGLQYCYEPTTRMCAIMRVFKDAIEKMHDKPSATVLKNIIQCYLIVSETSRLANNIFHHLCKSLDFVILFLRLLNKNFRKETI